MKEWDQNNYLEDFEDPEDRVLQNIAETDIANHNNLMLSGNSRTDYDAIQEVQIRWDWEHDFWRKFKCMLMVRILSRLENSLKII